MGLSIGRVMEAYRGYKLDFLIEHLGKGRRRRIMVFMLSAEAMLMCGVAPCTCHVGIKQGWPFHLSKPIITRSARETC